MFRDEGFKPKTKTVNFILLDGGLGDHIAALPALNYSINQYPWIKHLIWCPDYLVEFAKNVLPEGVQILGISDMRGRYEPMKPTKTTKWDGHTSPMKIHCVDYAFLKLLDELPKYSARSYMHIRLDKIKGKDFDLPERYVVLTTGFTAAVREWPAKEVNKVAQYLVDKNVTPVFLGQKNTKTGTAHVVQGKFNEEINYALGIDLIDKTSLLEAAAIMHSAQAVLGVDNGLLHVAGCTDTFIIGGYTTVDPELRIPVRRGITGFNFATVRPDQSLACKYCQSNTNFLYGHDYRNCLYKDNLCTTQMTAEKFIAKLEVIL